MALRVGDKANFETLLRAARHGNLALVESRRVRDGSYVALLAAITMDQAGSFVVTPFAELPDGNPFELYEDPTAFESFKKQDWSPRTKRRGPQAP